MAWRLVYSKRATRDLDDLPPHDRQMMHRRLGLLAADPGSVSLAKLAGEEHQWRLRSGRWRAILELDTRAGTITVLRVLPRNEGTYRG